MVGTWGKLFIVESVQSIIRTLGMLDEVVCVEDWVRSMAAGDCAGERREARGVDDGVESN